MSARLIVLAVTGRANMTDTPTGERASTLDDSAGGQGHTWPRSEHPTCECGNWHDLALQPAM